MRRIGDYSEEQVEGYVKRQTLLGLALKIAAAFVAVSICLGGIGWAAGWFRAGVQVVSPENVKAQWQFAYDYHENLRAIAVNWCTLKRAENEETNPDAKTQRVSQRLAVETQYRTVQAAYDGRLDDTFRAKLVAPPDVPRRAPTLEQTVAETGCMG